MTSNENVKVEQAASANISPTAQTASALPPIIDFTQARTFLANTVPWPGEGEQAFINIHVSFTGIDRHTGQEKTFWTGRACKTVDEAINYIEWSLKQPNTVGIYYCVSSQSECITKASKKGWPVNYAVRLAENAVALRALFVELDFKAHSSPNEALKALDKFIADVELPTPSDAVKSGNGLHIYWLLDRPLTPAEWSPLACALVEAMKQSGLKADYGCSVDCARILRVPCTWNKKYDPPRAVEVDGAPDYLTYTVERIKQSLEKYSSGVSARPGSNVVSLAEFRASLPAEIRTSYSKPTIFP
jgi:hypothetical protein